MLRSFATDEQYEAWVQSTLNDYSTVSPVAVPKEKQNPTRSMPRPVAKLTDEDLLTCLRNHWGHSSFRKNQLELCKAVLSGRDCFYMTATGSGKSLTFQLPAVALHNKGERACTLIVSPLLSLIEDQVTTMLSLGIKACMIGSQSSAQFEALVMHGEFTLIYCTPEKLVTWTHGIQRLRQCARLVCCAVDESHCIVEWGEAFRPEYRNLDRLRALLGADVPIVALTASATTLIEENIIRNLRLINPLRIRTSVNRKNLFYEARERQSLNDVVKVVLDHRKAQLASLSAENASSSSTVRYEAMLIYTLARKAAEEIAQSLTQCSLLPGLVVAFYHAGMTPSQRSAVHEGFVTNKIHIVVATNAFGMGIDKPDIRLVVHCGLSISVESYYQQTGRAGRDGLPSRCVLLWNRSDEQLCRNLANASQVATTSHSSSSATGGAVDSVNCAKAYARGDEGCRRKFLLQYFGEDTGRLAAPGVRCCDLCDAARIPVDAAEREALQRAEATDLSLEVYLLLRTVHDLGGTVYGATLPVSILAGKHDSSTAQHAGLWVFGQGKAHAERWWKALVFQLAEVDALLSVTSVKAASGRYRYYCYALTDKARDYLCGGGHGAVREFDRSAHRFRPALSKEMVRELSLESQAQRAASRAQSSLQCSDSQSKTSGPSGATSSSSSSSSSSLRAVVAFPFHDALKEDVLPPGKRTCKTYEIVLRRKQRELATLHGVNPHFVLSHGDLNLIVQAMMSKKKLLDNNSNDITVLTERLMALLDWKEWKRDYAVEFARVLHSEFAAKDASPSSANGDGEATAANPTEQAHAEVVQERDPSPPRRAPLLYRPDYSADTSPFARPEGEGEESPQTALQSVLAEREESDENDAPHGQPGLAVQLFRATSDHTSAAKAHKKRQHMGGIGAFKANKK